MKKVLTLILSASAGVAFGCANIASVEGRHTAEASYMCIGLLLGLLCVMVIYGKK